MSKNIHVNTFFKTVKNSRNILNHQVMISTSYSNYNIIRYLSKDEETDFF